MTEQNEYHTTDLYYAAFLQSSGVALLKADKDSRGKVTFVFDSSIANINELNQAWICQTGRVPARPYADAIKNLKAYCHM